jgi:glucan phosphoethanolaminetransferase (alkaline phosphatase superfamily)
MNGIEMKSFDVFSKAILVTLMISYLILLYCIFLFKKVLRYFQKVKLFDDSVIINMNKIGFWLVVAAFLDGVPSLIYRIMYQKKIGLEIGLSSFLIMLCFGLFFMVLSEVFKIAKGAKQENDLTI